ncbi:DUF2125 domain-containing protein [Aureimonas mangrovi]|uniref:DUF2125 domain-containing protein n=1 Tax=Aureimonas mangrovi TaxID=2758041 RepID=UPI00163DCCD1|nr:DUF2125 domain-containing protein [Aureimonas mangrovi]
MAGSSTKRRSGASRVFIGVILVVVLLAAALTVAWYYLAGELDRRVVAAIEAAAGDGVAVTCENREVFGYPFRIGLACDTVAVDAPESGVRASGGSLRTAAQVYDPRHIVGEFTAPVAVDAPDLPPLLLDWTLGQASARFENDGLSQLSVAIEAPSMALRTPEGGAGAEFARSDALEIHSRRNGDDLDLYVEDWGVTVTTPGIGELPTFTASANMTVAGAASWLSDGLPGGRIETALRGRSGTVHSLYLVVPGGAVAEASGPFSIADTGEISGDFTLSLGQPEAIAALVGRLIPGSEAIAGTLVGALNLVGRQEDGRTIVEIQVQNGRAQLGFIPLGRIPPI